MKMWFAQALALDDEEKTEKNAKPPGCFDGVYVHPSTADRLYEAKLPQAAACPTHLKL